MVILGGIWIWAKRKDNSKTSGKDVREVGDYVLGQGAQLKFVEINNEVWVLGLTAGNVNLLHRVPKGEWTDEHTQSDVTPQDFKSFYNLLKN
jgi:flagellar biogenesis protein FliO